MMSDIEALEERIKELQVENNKLAGENMKLREQLREQKVTVIGPFTQTEFGICQTYIRGGQEALGMGDYSVIHRLGQTYDGFWEWIKAEADYYNTYISGIREARKKLNHARIKFFGEDFDASVLKENG